MDNTEQMLVNYFSDNPKVNNLLVYDIKLKHHLRKKKIDLIKRITCVSLIFLLLFTINIISPVKIISINLSKADIQSILINLFTRTALVLIFYTVFKKGVQNDIT